MQIISPVEEQLTESWPRDFDYRAQYAEQQELICADSHPEVDSDAQRAIPLHSEYSK